VEWLLQGGWSIQGFTGDGSGVERGSSCDMLIGCCLVWSLNDEPPSVLLDFLLALPLWMGYSQGSQMTSHSVYAGFGTKDACGKMHVLDERFAAYSS